MQTRSVRTLGGILLLLGVFLGLALSFIAIWGDFEGFSYFNSGAGYQPFNGLNCPVLMTRSDTSVVTAKFNNPGSEAIEPYYEVAVSGPGLLRKLEGPLPVPAHTSRSIWWAVNQNDVALGFFIFIDLQVLPNAGYSTREATCGIMVLNLTGPTGGQVFAFTLAASLLGIVLGLSLWEKVAETSSYRYSNLYRALRTLGILVLLALLTSIMGLWAAGLLFCVMTILLLLISLRLSLESR